jgi:predicted Zn-dependent protease
LDRTGIPASFDFEGVPKQRVDLITRGVASGLVYDMQTATRAGRQSTGHGLPAPNTEGPFAVNLFMQPGTAAKANLMSDIKRGIWVTRFWYVRVVEPKQSVITGMTREGTFLIENGKITRPVKDLRFTQSILEAFQGTLALSRSTKLQVSEYLGASRVPAVRLKAFDFTS